MTSRDFVYWLQGFMEISDTSVLDARQFRIVQNHLNLVFKHEIDPSFKLTPEQSKVAQDIHDGKPVVIDNSRPPYGRDPVDGQLYRC